MSEKHVDESWKEQVARDRERQEEQARQEAETERLRQEMMKPTLTNFLSEWATRAMILLGEIPNPASGRRLLDLGGARYTIDILGILQEKTQGNLDDEEAEMLKQLLYQLRMRFVDRSKQVKDGTLKEGELDKAPPEVKDKQPGPDAAGDDPKILMP